MYITDVLLSFFSRFLVLIFMILYVPIVVICMFIPQSVLLKSRIFFWICAFFHWYLTKASLLNITFIGKENLPSEPSIFVANHQSSLDIPILGTLVKTQPHVWLATIDLLKSPILRFIIPKVAVIVDMATPMTGMRTLLQAIKIVNGDNKLHVMIFPEGGRYDDGQIHDFFSGFVTLAKKTGRSVVPVRFFNLNKAYPRGAFVMQHVPITVVIGKSMKMHEGETDEAFNERVYNWFIEQENIGNTK